MPAKRATHGGFSKGMLRDVAPWEAPEGFCWNAVDLLCDIEGKIRKRGGYTSPSGTNRTATVENLLSWRSGGVDALSALYGSSGKGDAQMWQMNRVTGAAFGIASATATGNTRAARPFQHGNYAVFSFQVPGPTGAHNGNFFLSGGQDADIAILAATVVANDNRVTLINPASVTALHLGSIIQLKSGGRDYRGRVIEVTSPSAVRVEPTPTVGFVANAGFITAGWSPVFDTTVTEVSGKYGVSYQGRMVFANTLEVDISNIAAGTDFKPNRVHWSALETDPLSIATGDGEQILYPFTFPSYNYVDIPDVQGITGLAVAGEGNLIVFGRYKTFRISGDLSTETVLNPTFSFTVAQISANVGCISDRSIQYTRGGLVFCGTDNLYVYDGAQMRPLLTGTNAKYLQQRLRAGDLIRGSAYSANTNHYYLSMSGSEGGLLFNLDGMQMTKLSNIVLFDSAPDPDDATKLWGAKWWNTGGAAPSMVAGQLVGMESIWLPSSANVNDGDGTAVTPVWESKAFIDGAIETLKRFTQLKIGYDLRYGAGVATASLSADTTMNTADAAYVNLSATLGTLPETPTEPGQKGFRCLPLLPKGQAIVVKLTATACDSFEILTVETEVQELRPGRSA